MLAPDAKNIVLRADFDHLAGGRSLLDSALDVGRHLRAWIRSTLR